jgi:ribonuclease HII
VVVDGNRVPVLRLPVEALVKGDALMPAISAASILAKVERDRLCAVLHAAHPLYGFATHKGYPTPDHLQALREHGPCVAHRRSFAPVRNAERPV